MIIGISVDFGICQILGRGEINKKAACIQARSSTVYFLFHELFLELDNPIVMASLRYSAADESEDTLNSFTSHTTSRHFFKVNTDVEFHVNVFK